MSYNKDIYLGLWMNRAYHPLRGASLTLDRQTGAVLIAFLALFIATTGKSFWKMICYGLHMHFSSSTSSDGLYHQRQAILRNSQSPFDAALDLVDLWFSWRRPEKQVTGKLLPVAGLAVLISIAFFISGILSSSTTTNGTNEVLIMGRNCGNLSIELPSSDHEQASFRTDYWFAATQRASDYLSYAHKCYRSRGTDGTQSCSAYAKSTLPYTKNTSAVCPFDPEICRFPNVNMFLNTGYLDSHKDLGVNKGPRFSFRLARHCGPLKTANYTEVYEDNATPPVRWLRYYYGRSQGGTRPYSHTLRMNNTIPLGDIMDKVVGGDYRITSALDFITIPALNQTNGAVSLMWLESSSVKYHSRVDDPWFTATSAGTDPQLAGDMVGGQYYFSQDVAQVLGCTTNLEICNPNLPHSPRCQDIVRGSIQRFLELWPSAEDKAIMLTHRQYLTTMYAGTTYSPDGFYYIRNLPALLTRFTLAGLVQTANIPSNRWQEELEYIFQANLAAAQARFVEFATGRAPATSEAFNRTCSAGLNCKRLCHSQKIRSASYYSFSVLGISIILFLGGLIILVGAHMESLAEAILKMTWLFKNSRLKYACLEWHDNSTWQLQRVAHENIGSGNWSRPRELLNVSR